MQIKLLYQKYKFYLLALFAFVWMLIFDSNNFIDLIQLNYEIKDLRSKKEYYTDEINKANKMYFELFTNNRNLEKFAREKYLMKKDNEDIFIIREKSKK